MQLESTAKYSAYYYALDDTAKQHYKVKLVRLKIPRMLCMREALLVWIGIIGLRWNIPIFTVI